MLSLNTTQQSIVDSESKLISWIFTATIAGPTTYYWSSKEYTFDGQSYDNRIIPQTFTGIQITPLLTKATFEITNPNNTLDGTDFENQTMQIDCVMNNWSKERIIATWKFNIKYCEHFQQRLKFHCEDFLQAVLEGDYPNTKLISDLAPEKADVPNDSMCIPVAFGTAYHPVRSIYITDNRYYFLGPYSPIYNITKIRSPLEYGSTSQWFRRGIATSENGMATFATNLDYLKSIYGADSTIFASGGTLASAVAGYTFSTATKSLDGDDYRVFQPIIADSDIPPDGLPDASGIWNPGGRFLDPLLQYTRSDTATMVTPHNVIEYVLEDMGVDSGNIDTGVGSTFETAGDTYTSWGLQYNGAFHYRIPRAGVMPMLLAMCNSTLQVTDKIELHVISKTSKMTLTSAHIIKPKEVAPSTMRYSRNFQKNNDSGYIAYVIDGEPQSKLTKFLIPAKITTDNKVDETLNMPFLNDSQNAQKAGILYFQHKLGHKAKQTFTVRDDCLVLQPKDVITLSGSDYGGTYQVMVESVTIKHDLLIDLITTRFEWALDDWEDLSPSAIEPAEDDTVNAWQPVISGPDASVSSGDIPNALPGKLRIGASGDYIVLDPAIPHIEINEGGYSRLRIGELDPVKWDRVALWGIVATDAVGTELLRIDTQTAFIAGWNITSEKLYTDNVEIDAANERIILGSGNNIIILDANDATYRIWSGHASAASAPFSVSKAGAIYSVSGTIGGFVLSSTKLTATNLVIDSANQKISLGSGNDIIILDAGDATYRLAIGKYTYASAPFSVTKAGVLYSISGTIGGWTIGPTTLYNSTGIILDAANQLIAINNTTFGQSGVQLQLVGSSPRAYIGNGSDYYFKYSGGNISWKGVNAELTAAGELVVENITATGGTIGGWALGTDTIYSTNIIIDSANEQIRSTNYVSGIAGSGFLLSADLLETANAHIRGVLRSAVFQYDVISAVGGNLLTTHDADVLNADMTADDDSLLEVEGNVVFAVDDFLRIKDGADDEWFEITNIDDQPIYTVTRDKDSQYGVDSNPAWKKGATVVNYGQSGDGGILITASQDNAPYMSIFTHAGNPWGVGGLTTRGRVGNLRGSYGVSTDSYGFAFGDSSLVGNYIKYDHVSGSLDIQGSINVTSVADISPNLGSMTAGVLTGITFHSTTGGRKLIINAEGMTLHVSDTVDKYKEFKYGDGTDYGSGALAYVHHSSQKVPFYVSAEQTAAADFHYYGSRGSVPSGPNGRGDTCVVSAKLMLCITAGTPGTWATVGVQV